MGKRVFATADLIFGLYERHLKSFASIEIYMFQN